MSQVSQQATLGLVLADYAVNTPDGKVTIVGGGVVALGFDSVQGMTSRFAVVAEVGVPAALLPAEFALEISLMRDGEPVVLPGPLEPQAVRVSFTPTLEKPQIAGPMAIRERLNSLSSTVLDFASGLPLAPNVVYEWVLRVDGDMENALRYPFAVAGGPLPPVMG